MPAEPATRGGSGGSPPGPAWRQIRPPSTALFDLSAKKAAYQEFGVQSYWVVGPDLGKPELIAFELRHDQYEQVAHVCADEAYTAQRPVQIEVVPSRLVAGLR
ncbi:MAG: hypothetical protein ACLPKI_01630 [Streptosporangiaceae bacterium]